MSANKVTVNDDVITVQVGSDQVTVNVVEGTISSAWGDITGTLANQTDLQSALDAKVDENAAIVGATKTKITYDAKGLVTAGADAAIADITGLQSALDGKVDENAAITGATKTKITYDAKGLVTAGADAAYSDFSFLPTQSGQNGKYLTTNGSTLAWGTVSTANIYNSDGSLTGNRALTLSGSYLRFVGSSFTNQFTSVGRLLLGTTTEGNFLLDVNGSTRVTTLTVNTSTAETVQLTISNRRATGSVGRNFFVTAAIPSLSWTSGAEASYNTGIGYFCFTNLTSGYYNTAMGHYSQNNLTTGNSNTSMGESAHALNASGNNNTAIGASALYFNTVSNNTAIGARAGLYHTSNIANSTSNNSVYVGYDTKASADGNTNEIVIGYQTLGNGSNSVTLGNTSITETYLRGRTRSNTFYVIPQSAAPTATAGALYYDSDDNKLKLYDGTNWVDLN